MYVYLGNPAKSHVQLSPETRLIFPKPEQHERIIDKLTDFFLLLLLLLLLLLQPHLRPNIVSLPLLLSPSLSLLPLTSLISPT